MFLKFSATLIYMTTEQGRERAAEAYRQRMAELGFGPTEVAFQGNIADPATVRAFVEGSSWPWPRNRKKLEEAVGWDAGDIDRIAQGHAVTPRSVPVHERTLDQVEWAIDQSSLTRANKAKLKGAYYEMLDDQERRDPG